MLEIAPDLVPADTSQEGPLFTAHIPALRKSVQAASGIQIPGVLVRTSYELAPSTFQITFNAGLPVPGEVKPESVFVVCAAEELRHKLGDAAHISEAVDPLTGGPACWVTQQSETEDDDRDGLPALRAAGAAVRRGVNRLWQSMKWKRILADTDTADHELAYPLRVLEALINQQPEAFLSVDETAALVESWRATELVGDGGLDATRLTTIFRDLLREGMKLHPVSQVGDRFSRASQEPDYGRALQICRGVVHPRTYHGAPRLPAA